MKDDLIQTFQLEASNLRGRILRMGPALDSLLKRHVYPAPVTRLTGEAACIALMLSSLLKYDGIFTLYLAAYKACGADDDFSFAIKITPE